MVAHAALVSPRRRRGCAAIARAATSADYFLTRQVAATGLSALPADVAVPALSAALRDTSALVRSSAAGELANVKDARALEIARNAWRADPSDAVRAAALGA